MARLSASDRRPTLLVFTASLQAPRPALRAAAGPGLLHVRHDEEDRLAKKATTKAKGTASYGAQDITVLEGLEAVRKRPGMYIGSTGVRGLHHLIYEVMDNSVDEALAGECDHVEITIHPDNRVTVTDNGRGIPVGHAREGEAPGRRGRAHRPARRRQVRRRRRLQGLRRPPRRRRLGGQRAVGEARPDDLARRPRVDPVLRARRAPGRAEEGREDRPARHAASPSCPTSRSSRRSTTTATTLEQRFREMAFLTKGLRIDFADERGEGFEDQLQVRRRHRRLRPLPALAGHARAAAQEGHLPSTDASDVGEVEVAMQWNNSYQESLLSFANNINTHEGGTHLSGFRSALTRTINAYARQKGELKEKDDNLQGEDVREGLTAIISVKIARPAVRGPDEDQARQPAGRGLRAGGRQQGPRRVPRGEPRGRAGRSSRKAVAGVTRPRGRAQGARPHPPQVGARELDAAGQARRLLGARPRARRAVRGRGRLRRRLGQAGPRPQHAGGPAAARQDHQRREEPDRQGPLATTRSRR